jgi:hypothetical protein
MVIPRRSPTARRVSTTSASPAHQRRSKIARSSLLSSGNGLCFLLGIWDMILLLRRPNDAAPDQEAKVYARCAKHFGSPEAAAAKKRAEFREALATRL